LRGGPAYRVITPRRGVLRNAGSPSYNDYPYDTGEYDARNALEVDSNALRPPRPQVTAHARHLLVAVGACPYHERTVSFARALEEISATA
jgi:hypothetical protein